MVKMGTLLLRLGHMNFEVHCYCEGLGTSVIIITVIIMND